jgi:putative ATPase
MVDHHPAQRRELARDRARLMASLFEAAGLENDAPRPLADRLRPTRLADVLGQDHLLGPEGPLGLMIAAGRLASIILWGPAGSGKTTIARLLAEATDLDFEPLSATFSGVADLRKVFARADERHRAGRGTLLFVDEVHRFNRAQQDAFLPTVEAGTVVLVGATTENPSFELNSALLSRCQVLVLDRLDRESLMTLLVRAETAYARALPVDADAREALYAMADGDGRYLLNMAETLYQAGEGEVLDTAGLVRAVQQRAPVYDKAQEGHYNLISALHKSLRGSDVDASLYWLARMLTGGEDPLYIVRRLVRFASEDVGLADPDALLQALAAKDAYHFVGSPEGELALAQAVIYLATAPKSNAAYRALGAALRAARETGSLMPPRHILNAPTALMRDLGYGEGYAYDHDTEQGFSGQDYFPEDMERRRFYEPAPRGFERDIAKRLEYWQRLRERLARRGPG